MLRYLNILAVIALLSSAIYAYSIKYDTILVSEQITKSKHAIAREKDAIAMLKSEWAHVTRPERVQILADKHLDLKAMSIDQVVKVNALPDKTERVDAIGRKLELLGLGEPTATPRDEKSAVKPGSTPTPPAR